MFGRRRTKQEGWRQKRNESNVRSKQGEGKEGAEKGSPPKGKGRRKLRRANREEVGTLHPLLTGPNARKRSLDVKRGREQETRSDLKES